MASRKKTTLSMGERLKVLDDLKTCSVSAVAEKYKVHPSTIWRIKTNAPKVMEFIDKGETQQKRRIIRPSLYDGLEKKLLAWFVERRRLGDYISNAVLLHKAAELKHSMGLPSDFKVSKGWLDGFKKRNDVQLVKEFVESPSVDEDSRTKSCDTFAELLEENHSVDNDNVYKIEETSLLWKALPSKVLVERKELLMPGNKSRKDRITVVLCANASGTHKLMPLIINRYANPRTLKHCRSNLPVIFKSQKMGLLTQILFCDWYENYFKPSVQAHQLNNGVTGKVILLLNNLGDITIPSELLDEADFKIMYLPSNTTSQIQPRDQGIIVKLKALYRHKIIQKATTFQGGVDEFQKQFTLKGCIQVLHDSWMEVSPNNIVDSWKRIIPNQIDGYHPAMKQSLSTLTGCSCTEEDIIHFMDCCEEEERRHTSEEEHEENQEHEEMQECEEEQKSKREELQYIFQRLEQHILQEEPFIKNIFKVFKEHFLGTCD